MSHYIPVFYFPVDKYELPTELKDWRSVENLIGERLNKREEYKLWVSTSRNGWFQHALGLICDSLNIEGHEFIQSEIACLDIEEIQLAIKALEELLNSIRDGIPDLGAKIEKEGSILFLRRYYKGNKMKKYSAKDLRRAYNEAKPNNDIEGVPDVGYESIVNFYSFIKSLLASARDCLRQGKCLLYVQPQP